ncbi:MAG TPA: glycosyltransferase family 4 protein, partial [Longimicrobiaceae bacterium]|nr:glycosyltransferase family 4 protein [Longimicrobiaceae bacterium]
MSGRRDGVLVVGPSAPAIGGIATYVDTMRGQIATELLVVNSVRGTGRKLGRFFRTLTGIARLRGRCRVLHLHSSHGTSFYEKVALLAAGRAMGYRTVLHMHGSNFEETVAHAPAPWLVRAGLESADVVIALSTHWTRVIQGAAPRARVMKLENVVQVPAAPCPARGSHDVLLLAGLEDRKGVPDAIHAFAAISARFPAARLVLAGPVAPHDGERYRELARTLGVADRVVFTGSVEGEAKAALLSGCGVFILPSYAEGLP